MIHTVIAEERRKAPRQLAIEINNDLHTRPAETTGQKVWRRTWMYAYQAEQFMHPAIRWVDNRSCIPIVPPGATDRASGSSRAATGSAGATGLSARTGAATASGSGAAGRPASASGGGGEGRRHRRHGRAGTL